MRRSRAWLALLPSAIEVSAAAAFERTICGPIRNALKHYALRGAWLGSDRPTHQLLGLDPERAGDGQLR
jgi:hypothetical protein